MPHIRTRLPRALALSAAAGLALSGCADAGFAPGLPDGVVAEATNGDGSPQPSRSAGEAASRPAPSADGVDADRETAEPAVPVTPTETSAPTGDAPRDEDASIDDSSSRSSMREPLPAAGSTTDETTSRQASPTPAPTTSPEPTPTATAAPAPSATKAPAPSPAPADAGDASDAGLSDPSLLKPMSPTTADDDGAVIENVVIEGDLVLTGHNQRVRNVKVEGGLRVQGSGTVIESSAVGALSVSGATDTTVRRVEVFGLLGKDGIHVTSDRGRVRNVLIEDSRIHSPSVTSNSHYDGIQVRGVDGLTLRGNSFELGSFLPQLNAAVFLEDANGGNENVLIEGNYLDGGGYAVYLGGENTVFRNNTFGPHANWGFLFPRSDMSSVTTSGNVGPDGAPVKF
jgi:hypothetical protein